MDTEPLADPVAEARRLISGAQAQGLILCARGGVAVHLQAPDGQPRLGRRVGDKVGWCAEPEQEQTGAG